MSIDGIGKGTPPAPATPVEAPAAPRPAESSRTFEVEPASVSGVAGVARAPIEEVSSSSLDQLRAGRIDLGRYLDLKVDEATAHLSTLPRVELDAIRSALRERLATDPALVDLVRTATGSTPQRREDG